MDCHCTRTKGEHLVYRRTAGGIPRHQPQAAMRGVPTYDSPEKIRGSCKLQGIYGHVFQEEEYP